MEQENWEGRGALFFEFQRLNIFHIISILMFTVMVYVVITVIKKENLHSNFAFFPMLLPWLYFTFTTIYHVFLVRFVAYVMYLCFPMLVLSIITICSAFTVINCYKGRHV